ncbi:hypothetical protein F9L16_23005 [Agarivorans sp. B2Z047]|nr:hypothetical protein [Agarivorans sp. B2Z047]
MATTPTPEIFKFHQDYSVRIDIKDGEPWFCLSDVCVVLDIKNPARVAKEMLDSKGVCLTYTLTDGGRQQLAFINEPNLYRVIFRSRKKEAEQFQKWVFEEVLPQIRKTGKYLPQPVETISNRQYYELKKQVDAISQNFHFAEKARYAIWRIIRSHLNATGVKQIPAHQYQECKNILSIANHKASKWRATVIAQEEVYLRENLGLTHNNLIIEQV